MSSAAKLRIFHNPRCSKSRQVLELLHERGVVPEVIEYLKTPPSASELVALLRALGMKPRQLLRTSEAAYRELRLDREELSDAQLIDAMVQAPVLIERPIVIAGARARIGRPPEAVLDLL